MKNNRLNGILTALRQEDCIILIGSGISMWSGLPSWKGLLEELVDFMEECGEDSSLVKREIENGDLLQAASYGFDRLTRPRMEDFMIRACRYGKANPHEIHKKILELGAKCFITTNYDKLLEMGIAQWGTKEPVTVVTNRQLSEMGRILQARAVNFVYKPHGDVGDVESIILTREQYRSLLLHGERHMALETLKTLMVSRPVVYMGFGLRDPDFLYIRDILSNLYQGNVRDHYAVMADVEEAEIDYWKRNYGIHLVGYKTRTEPDGTKSHTPLLELLDTLHDELHGLVQKGWKEPDQTRAEIILAFIRYAARFRGYAKAETEFGICIHRESHDTLIQYTDEFYGSLVGEFLTSGEEHAILVGAPGAGKSYAMRRAAAVMAQKLNETCMEESVFSGKSPDFQKIVIPMYIDLKLYDGDLEGMIEREFSKTLPLEMIIKECRCKIFLDSFNEMPKEYWAGGKYRQDFEKIFAKFEHTAIVIGSRTSDGLEAFGLPVYALDEIDRDTIDAELAKKGMTAELNEVMRGIVSKPFYFQYIISGKIEIKNIMQPKHFYREFFGNLQKDFIARFAEGAEIEKVLSAAAYRALDMGIEAFPVEFIYEGMNAQKVFLGMEEREEAVNWLIYKGIIIPHSNGKIAFVHQTITEYLAAKELMGLYWKDPKIIREKIKFYRWDQTIFFMVNLIPDDRVEAFIDHLFEIDFKLVFQSVQYMEFAKGRVINKILREITEKSEIRYRYRWDLGSLLEHKLRISEENEESIRKIIEQGGSIGGAAAFCLWRLKGDAVKYELMWLLMKRAKDEIFCHKLKRILSEAVEEPDLEILEGMVDIIQIIMEIEKIDVGRFCEFISTIASMMRKFREEHIRDILVGNSEFAEVPVIRKRIFCNYLEEKGTALSLRMATDLLMQGYRRASITMYFIMRYSSKSMPWDFFQREHIDQLIECLEDGVWALDTLQEILKKRTDMEDYVKLKAKSYGGIIRAALLAGIDPDKQGEVFQELEAVLSMEEDELEQQPFELLREIELTWKGREELFVQLLMLKDPGLMSGLMGNFSPFYIKGFETVEVENIDWWMDWMEELERNKTDDWQERQLSQIVGFLTQYTGPKSKEKILKKFNDRSCPYRKILLKYIIPELETCPYDFNENAIQYIFEDLKKTSYRNRGEHHFLVRVADEPFITERMIPLLEDADKIFRDNLISIIETAGRRHGKRYLV